MVYLFSFLYLPFFSRDSADNFSRKDRLYATLPANSRRANNDSSCTAANNWSDDEAVALNGDWVSTRVYRFHIGQENGP